MNTEDFNEKSFLLKEIEKSDKLSTFSSTPYFSIASGISTPPRTNTKTASKLSIFESPALNTRSQSNKTASSVPTSVDPPKSIAPPAVIPPKKATPLPEMVKGTPKAKVDLS